MVLNALTDFVEQQRSFFPVVNANGVMHQIVSLLQTKQPAFKQVVVRGKGFRMVCALIANLTLEHRGVDRSVLLTIVIWIKLSIMMVLANSVHHTTFLMIIHASELIALLDK